MMDQWGRQINYLRLSITDRCNMRCRYCMPDGIRSLKHDDILRYEEFLRLSEIALSLGINRFKVTGGEPLVRRNAVDFIAALKALPGVEQVTLTTNGYFLEQALPALQKAHIDGINISLDTLDGCQFRRLTGVDGCSKVLTAIEKCTAAGIRTKVNAVLLRENADQVIALAGLAQRLPVDVRFIEIMPIGYGRDYMGMTEDEALTVLAREYGPMEPLQECRGNGPAVYFGSKRLLGRIGFIAAQTHRFCQSCNRLRLTSTGRLKPCLCYDEGVELKPLLRQGASDETLVQAFLEALRHKPWQHCFENDQAMTERKAMYQIGG